MISYQYTGRWEVRGGADDGNATGGGDVDDGDGGENGGGGDSGDGSKMNWCCSTPAAVSLALGIGHSSLITRSTRKSGNLILPTSLCRDRSLPMMECSSLCSYVNDNKPSGSCGTLIERAHSRIALAPNNSIKLLSSLRVCRFLFFSLATRFRSDNK